MKLKDTSHRTFYVTDVDDIEDTEETMCLMRGVAEEHRERGIRALILGSYSVNMKDVKEKLTQLFKDKIPIFLVHGDKRVTSLRQTKKKKKNTYEMNLKPLARTEIEQSPCKKNVFQEENEKRRAKCTWYVRDLPENFMARFAGLLLGVHHSKYALMFCENHLRVGITTQNLKKGYVTDAVWFSPRIPLRKETISLSSDWCRALSNYMKSTDECLVWNAAYNPDTLPKGVDLKSDTVPLTLQDFICLYQPNLVVSKHSENFWIDLFEKFSFETLDTEGPFLVCSVPGTSPQDIDEENPMYGRATRRVRYLLRKLRKQRESLGETCSNENDDIFMQPTSISSKIHTKYLWTELMMCYSAGVMAENPRLIWPSERFSKRCKQGHSCAFFSPQAFVELGRDGAQNSFCHFDVTDCWKSTHESRMPHIKSVFRVLSSTSPSNDDDDNRVELEWLLVGSMCLSRGALGALTCVKHNVNYECDCDPKILKKNFRVCFLVLRIRDIFVIHLSLCIALYPLIPTGTKF